MNWDDLLDDPWASPRLWEALWGQEYAQDRDHAELIDLGGEG